MDWRKTEYWIAFCLIILALIYSTLIRYQKVAATNSADFTLLPAEFGDWVGQDFYFEQNVLDVLKAEKTFFRRYINSGGNEAWLFIGYWQDQKYGAQPHSPLHCLPGSGWNIIKNELVELQTKINGITSPLGQVNFATIQNGKKSESMLFWYQSRNGLLPKELQVKIDLAQSALFRKPTDVAFIRITSPLSETDSSAIIMDFWKEIQPYVTAALPFKP
jgi:EpsI family protein